jgi:hypothetical protein
VTGSETVEDVLSSVRGGYDRRAAVYDHDDEFTRAE